MRESRAPHLKLIRYPFFLEQIDGQGGTSQLMQASVSPFSSNGISMGSFRSLRLASCDHRTADVPPARANNSLRVHSPLRINFA